MVSRAKPKNVNERKAWAEETMEGKASKPHTPGIRLCKDGRYAIDCVKVRQGKRIHIYSSGYLSLEEAQSAMPRLVEAKTSYRSHESNQKMTVGQFLPKFHQYRLLHVRQSTAAFNRSTAHCFLQDKQSQRLEDVFRYTPMKQVYDTILQKKATPAWKNRAFGCFRQMIDAAFKWRLIGLDDYQDAKSVFENIPENRGAKSEKLIWTKAERDRFLSAISDPTDNLMFSLFATLGARIGEFMGLTWDCVDLRRGNIEIKQQLVYANTGTWVLSPDLKTRESYRLCKLPSKLMERLREYKASTAGVGFLFRAEHDPSQPLSKATFRRKFYDYSSLAGVKRVTPHSLRHRKATELMRVCRNMEEVKAAARYLGHSATMMVDTYGHSEKSATDAILRRLEKEEE